MSSDRKSRDNKVSELIDELNRNCIKCGYFVEATETCNMFKARPPARVIAYGCPEYDFIPF